MTNLELGLTIAGGAVLHLILMAIAFALPRKYGWDTDWSDGWVGWCVISFAAPEVVVLMSYTIILFLRKKRVDLPEARVLR